MRNNKVQIKEIVVKGQSGESKVTLWRAATNLPARVGDYVKISNVVVNHYNGQTSHSATGMTTVVVSEFLYEILKCNKTTLSARFNYHGKR